jgi:hypothetical protein
MADITDPDLINLNTEITLDFDNLLFELHPDQGNLALSNYDGVTGQALYSWFKEEWKNNNTAIGYEFPIETITTEQFEFINNWEPANDVTRKLIKKAGWVEKDLNGNIKQLWVGIQSQGNINDLSQPYYTILSGSDGTAIVPFVNTGLINEPVKIKADVGYGDFDSTASLGIYIRERGQTYAYASNVGSGYGNLTNRLYIFALSTATDSKITATDNDITTTTPYTLIDVTYYDTPQVRSIGGVNYNFNTIVDGSSATAEQIYEKIQYLLRLEDDIDSGAGIVTGTITPTLLEFVGDNLYTSQGVYVDNFNASDTNRLFFRDNEFIDTFRQFPFTSALTLTFSNTLQNDNEAIYKVFSSDTFNTTNATIVTDANGDDMSGSIDGATSITHSFPYDEYSANGHTPGSDLNITVIALGLTGAQYIKSEGTIERSTTNQVALVSQQERVYENL